MNVRSLLLRKLSIGKYGKSQPLEESFTEIQDRPANKERKRNVVCSAFHTENNRKITLKYNYPRELMIGDNQETVQLQIR